jgi:hypothetical protein
MTIQESFVPFVSFVVNTALSPKPPEQQHAHGHGHETEAAQDAVGELGHLDQGALEACRIEKRHEALQHQEQGHGREEIIPGHEGVGPRDEGRINRPSSSHVPLYSRGVAAPEGPPK